MNGMSKRYLNVKFLGLHAQTKCFLFGNGCIFGYGHVFRDLSDMSHLIIFVFVETEPVNEISSLISNVASGEFLPVSHQFKAQRAKGVGIFEVGGVRLQG